MGIRIDVSVLAVGMWTVAGADWRRGVGLLSTRRKNLRPVCRSVQCHERRKHVSETTSSDCQVQGAKDQKHPGQSCSATC